MLRTCYPLLIVWLLLSMATLAAEEADTDAPQTIESLLCARVQRSLSATVKYCAVLEATVVEGQQTPALDLRSEEFFDAEGSLVQSIIYNGPVTTLRFKNTYGPAPADSRPPASVPGQRPPSPQDGAQTESPGHRPYGAQTINPRAHPAPPGFLTQQISLDATEQPVDIRTLQVARDGDVVRYTWSSARGMDADILYTVKGVLDKVETYRRGLLEQVTSYDDHGRVVQKQLLDPKGVPVDVVVYERERNVCKESSLTTHQQSSTRTVYDSRHLPTRKLTIPELGTPVEQVYQYTFDADGNWIQRRIVRGPEGGRVAQVTVRRLRYFVRDEKVPHSGVGRLERGLGPDSKDILSQQLGPATGLSPAPR